MSSSGQALRPSRPGRDGCTYTMASPGTLAAPISTRPASCFLICMIRQQSSARCRCNILEPREPYELSGQVPNVVFPSGMIVEHFDADGFALPDSPVKVYYGAADSVVGLATTTVQELLAAAREGEIPSQGL